MRVAGFVLTGGQSTRMGRDKARLPVDAHLLIQDVASKLAGVANNLALVGRPEHFRDLDFECLDDFRHGFGPLGGIETALRSQRGELNLIVACDMPGLQTTWLQGLVDRAKEGGHRCVVCRDASGMLHPLCAVYHSSCLTQVERSVDMGRLRLLDLVKELQAEEILVPVPISNVNSPGDWVAWQEMESANGPALALSRD